MDGQAGFARHFGGQSPVAGFSPGRVNLIGEHIDYCGGQVLPMAISLGTRGWLRPVDGPGVRIFSTRFDEMAGFSLASLPVKRGHWVDYAVGIAAELHQCGNGFDMFVTDDIAAGGLSSSASFTALVGAALMYANGLSLETPAQRLHLARLCQRAENGFVGVSCGIMDQASVLLGGTVLLDCANLVYEAIEADFAGYQLVVMDTCVPRTLAASAYAQRVEEVAKLCELLPFDVSPDALCQHEVLREADVQAIDLPGQLKRRLLHLVSEQRRVEHATRALHDGDYATFGRLMTESHRSLRDDYEVTGEALDRIVEISLRQPGVLGARMTGAGFGGCAIALVAEDRVEQHNDAVTAGFKTAMGHAPRLFGATPSAGLQLPL